MRSIMKIFARAWKLLPASGRRWLTRRFQASFTASAAGVVTDEHGRVLLLDHVLRPRSGWGVPGGFLNKGEQPEHALRREIREETGLELKDVRLIRVRTVQRHMELVFAATAVGEAFVNSPEIKELRWFDVESMPPDMSLSQQFLIRSILRPELE
jgi:ADP-ribose pyrophosphatase YjhB (NUDIX family)